MPQPIDFGTLLPGDQEDRDFSIPPGDRGAASVSGAGFSLEGFTNGDATATVKFTAGSVAKGDKTGTLTYGPENKTVALEAKVDHELSVPARAYLGTLLLGASNPKVIPVTNRTDANATITITSDYTVTPTTVPASAGPMNVTVTFTPTAVGDRIGSLKATVGQLEAETTLTGVGTEESDNEEVGELGVTSVETSDGGGGTNTTYKVHVPSQTTAMHLGAAVSPFPSLDGFGLRTEGKGLLQANSHIGINSTTGDVRVQAQSDDGTVLTVSGGNSIFAAKGSAYLVGDGGVLVTTALNVETSVGTNGIPNPADMTTGSNVAAGVFAALDGLVALASAARAIKTTSWSEWGTTNKRGRAAIGAGAVSAGAALFATFLAGNSVGGAAGGDPWVPVPGVTVYGHAGVLLGTPGFGGFYSAAGLVLASVFPIMMGMDSEILGLRSAGVTGNDVGIDGWVDVEVKAGKKFVTTAGKSVELTANDGAGTLNKLFLNVDDRGGFAVGDFAITLTSDGVMVGNRSATGAVDTTKPHAKIDASEINLLSKDGGSLATITDGTLTFEHAPDGTGMFIKNNLVSLYDKGSGGKNWVKVANTLVEVQGGSASNKVQASSSGIVVKGAVIKLG